MSDDSWGDADRRNRDRSADEQAEAARQSKEAQRAHTEQVRRHAEGVAPINHIIEQFIATLRSAGSPELMVKKPNGHWEPAWFFKGWRSGMWTVRLDYGGSSHEIDVHTDGDWSFRYHTDGVQGSGPGGDVWPQTHYLCSRQISLGRALSPEDYARHARKIREILAEYLRDRDIPLPRGGNTRERQSCPIKEEFSSARSLW